MTAIPLRDDTEALLALFNSADHGPSQWGLSTHGDWIDCSRRAQLKAAERAVRAESLEAGEEVVEIGSKKLNYMKVGLHAHKLFEGRILRQLGTDLIWDARAGVFDMHFLEAVRLYRAYHKHWTSIEEKWGCKVIACELPLGASEEVSAEVIRRLGGPLTGRADAIIDVIYPEKARANTGVVLLPGRYIFDYKCSKSHGSHDDVKFGPDNLQAQAYLWLDLLERGEGGALGTIFERLIGHQTITKVQSYASFVVYPQLEAEDRLRATVQASLYNQANPHANPLACIDFFGKQCWFKTNGTCKGY
jgi:hypothetical protein